MKIIDDTLKNPRTGEWSRKNLTSFVSLIFAIAYVSYCTVYDKTLHEFVVLNFLALAGGMLGVSSWEKLNLKKNDKTNSAGSDS